jgi:hypothetical protein
MVMLAWTTFLHSQLWIIVIIYVYNLLSVYISTTLTFLNITPKFRTVELCATVNISKSVIHTTSHAYIPPMVLRLRHDISVPYIKCRSHVAGSHGLRVPMTDDRKLISTKLEWPLLARCSYQVSWKSVTLFRIYWDRHGGMMKPQACLPLQIM